MKPIELSLTITKVDKCRVGFTCAYCKQPVKTGNAYMKIMSRLPTERFPVTIKICNEHKPALIPLSVCLNREAT